jgi:hypothetical protein
MNSYTLKEALTKEIKSQLESFIYEVSADDKEDVDECMEYRDSSIYKVKKNNISAYRIVRYLKKINCLKECHLNIIKEINKDCINFEKEPIHKDDEAIKILSYQKDKYLLIFSDLNLDTLSVNLLKDIATVLMHYLHYGKYEYLPLFCSTEDSFDSCTRCSMKKLAEAANFGRYWLLFEKKEQVDPFYYKLNDVVQYRGSVKKTDLPFLFR